MIDSISRLAVFRTFFLLLVIVFPTGCSKKEIDARQIFIGKWQSSILVTPLYLHENGEWEIKKDDGTVLQYGVWEYRNNKIFWTYKIRSQVSTDANEVLQVQPSSFQLRESDRTITSFKKLN